MTLSVRVIPCLDVDAGRVVKGVNFQSLRDAGDPVEMARLYDAEGADELVFLDITASSAARDTTYDVVRRTAEQVFIPLTVGGGVRSPDDVDRLLRAGADKVGHQHGRCGAAGVTARMRGTVRQAMHRPVGRCPAMRGPGRTDVRSDHARRTARHRHRCGGLGGAGVPRWARARSCSIRWTPTARQRASTWKCTAVRREVNVPLIASGGAGAVEHFPPAVAAGADAVLAASVFHFGTLRIRDVKAGLRDAGYPVRL